MGIFSSDSRLFTRYRAHLQFRGLLMGGIPKNPEVVEGWIRAKSGVTGEEEIQAMVQRTMQELGTWKPDMSAEEIASASKQVAAMKQTTGFKRDDQGLYIEDRQIKAAIKEAVNILYPWEGSSSRQQAAYGIGKSARSFLAERVFISPSRLHLGRMEPDSVELMIGQISGAQGRRSTLGYHEAVDQAELTFDVLVMRNAIPEQWWPELWELMQENGIGALRSQSYGRFDIMQWEKIDILSSAPGTERANRRPAEAVFAH